jgi:hypothetical protein
MEVLELFTRYNRATFRDALKEEPPAWDRRRPIKRWADTSVADAPPEAPYIVQYWQTRAGMIPQRMTTVITNHEAATLNLPGSTVYPKYTLAPSGAVSFMLDGSGSAGIRQTLPPEVLATKADAAALADELRDAGMTVNGIADNEAGGPFGISYEAWESRRLLNVSVENSLHNVGKLLAAKNAFGVGAPGSWSATPSGPKWTSEIPQDSGEFDARPEVPIPARELLAGEQFVLAFGGTPAILNLGTPEGQDELNEEKLADNVAEILKRVTQIQRDVISLKK